MIEHESDGFEKWIRRKLESRAKAPVSNEQVEHAVSVARNKVIENLNDSGFFRLAERLEMANIEIETALLASRSKQN